MSVLGGLVAVIIVLTAVFTVYNTDARCLTDYGDDKSVIDTINATDPKVIAVADEFKYKNIFLLNEQEVVDAVNSQVLNVEATRVESVFPNKIIVHYYLLTEDLQFSVGDKYIVTGATGKILASNDYDSTVSGNYNDTLIRVVPHAAPESSEVGTYAYSDRNCYDMTTLATILDIASRLQDIEGERVFNKGSMLEIDLSDEHLIYITMRSGVTFRLYGGANKLEEKIRSMASWFVSVEDYKTMRGTATISDDDPERVTYTPSPRT